MTVCQPDPTVGWSGSDRKRPSLVAVIVLGGLVTVGTLLRLHHLDERTLSHPEVYVPGIVLPAGVSEPPQRLTLLSTVTGSMWDVHPPTWYLGMWFWTKRFGTSLFAMRLPSVLFGVAAIILVYCLATLALDRTTGLLSATFLALNGHHVFWSQMARPYAMMCALGLCATALLLLACHSGPRRGLWTRLYAVIALWGLATLYYFWLLFLTHVVWIQLECWRRRAWTDGLARWQMLVLMLAAPVITLAVFQSRSSYLGEDTLGFLRDFVGFGFLFEGCGPVACLSSASRSTFLAASAALFAIGLITAIRTNRSGSWAGGFDAPSRSWLGVAAAFSVLVITVEAVVFSTKAPQKAWLLFATVATPIVLLAIAPSLTPRVTQERQTSSMASCRLGGGLLIALLAIIPAIILGAISLVLPFFASRNMLIFTPYLLILLAAGLRTLSRAGWFGRGLAPMILAAMALVHGVSVSHHVSSGSVRDYRALAAAWVPEMEDDDLVFVQRSWVTTPVFYYLDIARYRFVGGNFTAALAQPPHSRLWVLLPHAEPMPDEMSRALDEFVQQRVVSVDQLRVELYARRDSPQADLDTRPH